MTRRGYTGTKLARREGAATVRGIRATCREARATLTDDARARRLALREAIRNERAALRGSCSLRLDQARAATAKAIDEARSSAMELDRLRKVTRTPAQQSAAERARLRGAERIRESDDEVRRNLPDDLAHVWERVKGRIKGTARTTRTERFLDWVHDHAAEVARMVNDRAEQAHVVEETEEQYLTRRGATPQAARELARRAAPLAGLREPTRELVALARQAIADEEGTPETVASLYRESRGIRRGQALDAARHRRYEREERDEVPF